MKKKTKEHRLLVFFCIVVVLIVTLIMALLFFQPQIIARLIPQTQQFFTQQTQQLGLDEDKRNQQRFTQGCLSGDDCIPAIQEPKYVEVRQAKFMKPDDLVIGVAFPNWQQEDDYVRAYPLKIMNWHEVVNTSINESPLLVTYSPLTMTPRVYHQMQIPQGGYSSFGVSGMMLNSNPVLYDRETKSLWSQFDGVALTGPDRGKKLEYYDSFEDSVPVKVVRWADWVKEYPLTEVLSTDTGYDFDYNKFPYGEYEKNSEILFPLENSDNRLPAKDIIFGIEIDGNFKAYPQQELKKTFANATSVDDVFAGHKFTLTYAKNVLTVTYKKESRWVRSLPSYYFVWEAFHPGADIYKAPETKSVKS